ncbi:hypothetical protein GCM10010231_41310 [Streptomyces sindenensis]|nr:hypothetical protein GCM10010231_41310 [Streptomyces sindenensis]
MPSGVRGVPGVLINGQAGSGERSGERAHPEAGERSSLGPVGHSTSRPAPTPVTLPGLFTPA